MVKVIHKEMCKKYEKVVYSQPRMRWENETDKIFCDFEIHIDHLISARRQDQVIVNEKKRTWLIVDFAIPADHSVKLKECE